MPLYDFHCERCGARFEARSGFDDPPPPCPECGAKETERVITGFATSRSPAPRGVAAQRSNDSRRAREEQRAVRREQRRSNNN